MNTTSREPSGDSLEPTPVAAPARRRSRERGGDRPAVARWLWRTWGAFLVIAPQLLGGATPGMAYAILALGAGLCMLTHVALRAHGGDTPWTYATCAAGLAAGATLLQTVPLPCTWVGALYPARVDLYHTLTLLGQRPLGLCTLSAAPGSTIQAAAMAFVLLAIVACSAALAMTSRRLEEPALCVASSAAAMALVAAGHWVAGATQVFGMYRPEQATPGLLIAPLLNANHLAGLFVLGFPACLSVALHRRSAEGRWLWACAALLVAICSAFTLSRGGIGAMVVAGAGFYALRLGRKRGRRRGASQPLGRSALVLTTLVSCVLAAIAALDPLLRAFGDEGLSLEKLRLAGLFAPLIMEHPWFGIGRGAIESASPALVASTGWAHYVENLPIQWAAEWGVPVTMAVLGLVLATLLRARLSSDYALALCAGLVALGVHNLVDFSLELPGVASVAAFAFGALASSETATKLRDSSYGGRARALSAAAACVVVVLSTPVYTALSAPSLRDALESRARDGMAVEVPPGAFELYPNDPVMLMHGAARAVRDDDKSATAWLNLTMNVTGNWSSPHLLASHWLERRNRFDQAAIELSLAYEQAHQSWQGAACAFVQRHPSRDLALATLPDGPKRLTAAEGLVHCLGGETQHLFASTLWQDHPDSVVLGSALSVHEARTGRADEAIARLRAMVSRLPTSEALRIALIDTLRTVGRHQEAAAAFDELPPHLALRPLLLRIATLAAADARDLDRVRALGTRLLANASGSESERGRAEAVVASALKAADASGEALAHAQRAYLAEGSVAHLRLVYDTAQAAQVPGVASQAAHELCLLEGTGSPYCPHATR
jgi:tetratricopeptide (TPR) repeat protein